MKYYSIGEFSSLIGKTPQTLRDWHKKGKEFVKTKNIIKLEKRYN